MNFIVLCTMQVGEQSIIFYFFHVQILPGSSSHTQMKSWIRKMMRTRVMMMMREKPKTALLFQTSVNS